MQTGNFISALIASCIMSGVVSNAGATIIQDGDAYEVSYRLNLDTPTPTGNDVLGTFIFEWNDNNFNVDSPFSIASSGRTDLQHVIDFEPTSALVLGYLEGMPNVGDEKKHLYMLMDGEYSDYLAANNSGQKFSEIFGVGEQFTINLLIDALAGNEDALTDISALVTNEFAAAAFDPAGGFQVMKWSPLGPPVGSSVPEPSSLALLGLGLLGLGFSRKK